MSLFDDTSTTTTAPTAEPGRIGQQAADEREEPTGGSNKWVEVQQPTCPARNGRYCRSTCAWWIDGNCAAVVVATALRDITKNGIEAYTYPN